MKHSFGGNWTEEKLERIEKYLRAYTQIMKDRGFRIAYIDAFAGTGYRTLRQDENTNLLLPELSEEEARQFLDGSARIALRVQPRFTKYIFIEKDVNRFIELGKLKDEFSAMRDDIILENADANKHLVDLCSMNWKQNRAVLFLDPYGMQVPWTTIEAIAKTNAIDLWYLFPLGIAVNRLLRRDGNINQVMKRKLDEILGETAWYEAFYRPNSQLSMFDNVDTKQKFVNLNSLAEYFVQRLKSVFPYVAENPLLLRNSKNNPLFLLCFASANKNAAKIASDVLRS